MLEAKDVLGGLSPIRTMSHILHRQHTNCAIQMAGYPVGNQVKHLQFMTYVAFGSALPLTMAIGRVSM